MKSPATTPEPALEGVRTAEALLCPICRRVPLRQAQTACSGKCRATRWRQRRQQRDDELRALALAARQAIEALARRLEESA